MLACRCLDTCSREEDDADVVCDMESPALVVDHMGVLTSEADLPKVFPSGPKATSAQLYGLSQTGPLNGQPLKCGQILVLQQWAYGHEARPPANEVKEAWLAVYAKGFTITPAFPVTTSTPEAVPEAIEKCLLWSPFSSVERHDNPLLAESSPSQYVAMFKLTTFQWSGVVEHAFYFSTVGTSAEDERTKWIDAMASGITSVTESLFPPQHAITASPVPGVHATSTRIMAGYLLYLVEAGALCVAYCELHTYLCGESRLSMYKSEWCDSEIMAVPLSQESSTVSRKGLFCTTFLVDQHVFAARSVVERELWVRALGNIKVKLVCNAPDPTSADLAIMRRAVHDQVLVMAEDVGEAGASWVHREGPLLPELPRGPLPFSPSGDIDAGSCDEPALKPKPVLPDVHGSTLTDPGDPAGCIALGRETPVGGVAHQPAGDVMQPQEVEQSPKSADDTVSAPPQFRTRWRQQPELAVDGGGSHTAAKDAASVSCIGSDSTSHTGAVGLSLEHPVARCTTPPPAPQLTLAQLHDPAEKSDRRAGVNDDGDDALAWCLGSGMCDLRSHDGMGSEEACTPKYIASLRSLDTHATTHTVQGEKVEF